MTELTQILCPVDFSEPSMHALGMAAILADRLHLPLELVHVIVPMPAYAAAPEAMVVYPPPYPMDDSRRDAQALEQLQGLQRQFEASGVAASIRVMHGPAGRSLVELATPNTLIVLGTHGYKGFQRFVLGSTTAEILRRAPCPVLAVRERHHEWPLRRIGVGVDFSAACEPAIEASARLARVFGAELHLIHVMQPIEVPNSAETHIPLYVDKVGEATQMAAQRELEEIASRIRDCNVHRMVLTGQSAYRDLAHYAQDLHLDLLALGTHGRTGLRRLFLGSTAERALQVSPCPVLAVKLPQDVPEELSWRDVADELKLRREL